jgi:hypothetical protein
MVHSPLEGLTANGVSQAPGWATKKSPFPTTDTPGSSPEMNTA